MNKKRGSSHLHSLVHQEIKAQRIARGGIQYQEPAVIRQTPGVTDMQTRARHTGTHKKEATVTESLASSGQASGSKAFLNNKRFSQLQEIGEPDLFRQTESGTN